MLRQLKLFTVLYKFTSDIESLTFAIHAVLLQELSDREELKRQQEEFRLEQEELERQRLEQERIEQEELDRKKVCVLTLHSLSLLNTT